MALNPLIQNPSRAVFTYPITLSTYIGIKTYNRTFNRIDAAFYLAQILVRVQGSASRAYEPEIAQVNVAMNQELQRLADVITTEANTLENRLKKAPTHPDPAPIRYTHPAQMELVVRTPKAGQYARLLDRLEHTARRLDTAWSLQVIDESEQLQRSNTLFRAFNRACGVIERLARGLAQRVREDDREPAPAYTEMLIKRTGRGPGAAPEPAVADENASIMTPTEEENLQDMEALAVDLEAHTPVTDPSPAVETEGEADATSGDEPSSEDVPVLPPETDTAATEASIPADGETPAVEDATADRPGRTQRLRDALRYSAERATV